MASDSQFNSPDGLFRIEISPIPMLMSHEVDSPALFDNQTGQMIFDPGSLWSASGVLWSDDSRFVSMSVLRYPNGSFQMKLKLDLVEKRGELTTVDGGVIFSDSFAGLQNTLQTVGNLKPYLPKE